MLRIVQEYRYIASARRMLLGQLSQTSQLCLPMCVHLIYMIRDVHLRLIFERRKFSNESGQFRLLYPTPF